MLKAQRVEGGVADCPSFGYSLTFFFMLALLAGGLVKTKMVPNLLASFCCVIKFFASA